MKGRVRQAKRKAREDSRIRKAESRVTSRENVAKKRVEKRESAKTSRINKRANAQQTRISKRSAKQLEKIYKDISPEDIKNINSIKPYIPTMRDELDQAGIGYNDEDDIEIANKFAFLSEDIDNPYEDEIYNDAFINDEGDYETSVEHFAFMKKAKDFAKKSLPYIGGAIQGIVGVAEEKQRLKVPLTETEEKLLKANQDVRDTVKDAVKKDISQTITDSLPIVIALLVLYLVLKK
jgi:hypothetical protein